MFDSCPYLSCPFKLDGSGSLAITGIGKWMVAVGRRLVCLCSYTVRGVARSLGALPVLCREPKQLRVGLESFSVS